MDNRAIVAFDGALLDSLSARAAGSARLRQHQNIHTSYDDPCQRFLNAIEPGSYLRPNRHAIVPRNKLLAALRGRFAAVIFDDRGAVTGVTAFGIDASGDDAPALEIASGTWNTVLSLATGSVLLEVKAGPFDPAGPREAAPWAAEEGSQEAHEYLTQLERIVSGWPTGHAGSGER